MSDDPLGSFREQLVDGVRGEPRRRRRRRAAVGAAAAALVVAAGAVAVNAGGSDDQHVTADGSTTTTTPPFDCPVTRAARARARRRRTGTAGPSARWRLVRHRRPWTALPSRRVEPRAPQERVVEPELPGWRRRGEARGIGHLAPARRPVRAGGARRGAGYQRLHARHRLVHDRLGMDPIRLGCWEVTGSYKGHELSYVYEVRAAARRAPTAVGCRRRRPRRRGRALRRPDQLLPRRRRTRSCGRTARPCRTTAR